LAFAGRLAGIIAVALASAPPAAAEEHAATACQAEAIPSGKVRSVTDGRSFILEDGREIRLAAIEVPLPPRPGEAGAEDGIRARAALEALIAGASVELRQAEALPDRYGRILAFVFREDGAASVAHRMVAEGFARVSAHVGQRPCAAELWGEEFAARRGRLGLWGEPEYAVTQAEGFADLLARRGLFTVVEGKVVSVRESGGTIYINFGRRWSQALTVTIQKRNERTFTSAGIEPRRLESRRVRVRGWVEERSGPRIEATRAEQIEIADRN
jgi:endonuclease YncB( thermonuclease family)